MDFCSRSAQIIYQELGKIGQGAFGEVYVAVEKEAAMVPREKEREGYVAIKKIRLSNVERDGIPKPVLREIRALQHLEHEHVLALLDIFPQGSSLSLVLEYMPSDLEQVIEKSTSLIPESHIKSYMWMLLQGVKFLHAQSIIHRDLKPSNLLLSDKGILKIADFDLARVHHQPQIGSYSHQVATRWYRAPELLFGSRSYGFAVDLWACGTIYAELVTLKPLFPGNSDIEQIYRVLQVLGTPNEDNWPVGEASHDMAVSLLPDYHKLVFAPTPAMDPAQAFPLFSLSAREFLFQFLSLDPFRRVPAVQALTSTYFFSPPLPAEPWELKFPRRLLPPHHNNSLKMRDRRRGNDDWDGSSSSSSSSSSEGGD